MYFQIDISKCPQPPIMSSNKELINKKDEIKFEKIEAKDDKELFSRIINILTEQIKVSFCKFIIVFL